MRRSSGARAGVHAAALLALAAACDLRSDSPPIDRALPEITAGPWTLTPHARATGRTVRSCAQSYTSTYDTYLPRIELAAIRREGGTERRIEWSETPISISLETGYSSEARVLEAIEGTTIEHCISPDARTVALRGRGAITHEDGVGEWWLVRLEGDHPTLTEQAGARASSCEEVLAAAPDA